MIYLPQSTLDLTRPELITSMRKHHWRRYFELRRVEACCLKNHCPDLARYADMKAMEHHRMAKSLK